MGKEQVRMRPASSRDCDVLVAYSPQGKLSLLSRDELGTVPAEELVGGLQLGTAALERAAEAHEAWWAAERHEREGLEEMLATWQADGSLPARVRQVADWVDRVETVLIYIGRQVYSRSDAGSNTLLRGGILDGLACRPLASWTSGERLLVAAAHVLFRAGRSIRFEEFNGRQLSAVSLRSWLVDRWRRYAAAAGEPVPADLATRPAAVLAGQIAELSTAVDNSGWLRFRRISGITFAKREVIAPVPLRRRSHEVLPVTLAQLTEDEPAVEVRDGTAAEQVISDAIRRLAGTPSEDTPTRVEALLAAIVAAAVRDLAADYGMSSAIRDLTRLMDTPQGCLSKVLDLRKPDFFCCALPHPELARARTEPEITRLLWTVAQRMQYNRWHFVPGNFDRADIPAQRHYFFPPTMPDIAEHSDLWHGGHVAASVRYSIRAPGAQLWRPPLMMGGNSFRGGYDIRVVRMRGCPFTRDDLWTAVRYSGLVDAFWRTLATLPSPPVISAFGREWYKSAGWRTFCGLVASHGAEAVT
jgi:hypothetical protein